MFKTAQYAVRADHAAAAADSARGRSTRSRTTHAGSTMRYSLRAAADLPLFRGWTSTDPAVEARAQRSPRGTRSTRATAARRPSMNRGGRRGRRTRPRSWRCCRARRRRRASGRGRADPRADRSAAEGRDRGADREPGSRLVAVALGPDAHARPFTHRVRAGLQPADGRAQRRRRHRRGRRRQLSRDLRRRELGPVAGRSTRPDSRASQAASSTATCCRSGPTTSTSTSRSRRRRWRRWRRIACG